MEYCGVTTAATCGSGKGEGEQLRHLVIELEGVDTAAKTLPDGSGLQTPQHAHSNFLSAREMESLTAICDTFLPAVAADVSHLHSPAASFFQTSASAAGTPERVARLISERVKHPKKWLMRVSLWMLSTWYGTCMLCGKGSLSRHFPYFQRFSKVSQKKREEIVFSWSLSYFLLLRMFFRTIKILSLLAFFTQVDEKKSNISWKAIDYPGPDPQFRPKTRQTEASKLNINGRSKDDEKGDEELCGPLFKGIVNLKSPREVAAESLRNFGFRVSILPLNTKTAHPAMIIKCDAVVVGSGSGGGVVAGVLANAGYKVLVLEKGSYCARTNLSLLEGPSMEEMYLSSGLVATDNMNVLVLAGSTVGGGSTVNWSASLQTPSHVIREWSDVYELELFSSSLYKEALAVVCKKMGVQSEIDNEGFNNAVLRKGCKELGYPVMNIPRNSPSDHYCGWCCLGCKNGKKKGTAETWLVDLVRSGNGAILPGCEAIEVRQEKKQGRERNRAKGVAFEFGYGSGAKHVCLVESKVTIVACGALSTPPLLKKSGLRNPNIGKNLHLHPVTMAWGHFPAEADDVWPEVEKKSYEGGIMTAMSSLGSEPNGSGYGAVLQTPALHPGLFSILMPWVSGTNIKHRMCKFSRTAHVFALARDKGSGTVKSSSSISYKMGCLEEENLNKGLEKALKILAAAGAEEIGTHHNKGRSINVKKVSYREYEQFVKEESSRPLNDLSTPICSAHQMGSCRMGIGPKDSVVNQRGETWEVEGLFIADSSVFPTALGVNPMVTVQAIAYCTAQSVVETLRRKRN